MGHHLAGKTERGSRKLRRAVAHASIGIALEVWRLFFRTGAGRTVQRRDLLANDRILGSFIYIDLRPVSVVLGNVRVGEDRFDRTFRHARITIDASISVDVKTIR